MGEQNKGSDLRRREKLRSKGELTPEKSLQLGSATKPYKTCTRDPAAQAGDGPVTHHASHFLL